jgi:hemin uptake protein HemP
MRFILICIMDAKALQRTSTEQPPATQQAVGEQALRRLSSAALLQGQRQVVIEHGGREYRLRLTAQGKLILTA